MCFPESSIGRSQAQVNEDRLLQHILKAGDKERAAIAKRKTAELNRAEKRKTEQQELIEKIDILKAELSKKQQTVVDSEKWIALIKQYAYPKELTAELLNTLIEKIVIHEAVKGEGGMRDQKIEIFYRFVGKIE